MMLTNALLPVLLLILLPVAHSCGSEHECSLNGVCTALHGNEKRCLCDLPWMGASCAILSMLPVNASTNYGASVYG